MSRRSHLAHEIAHATAAARLLPPDVSVWIEEDPTLDGGLRIRAIGLDKLSPAEMGFVTIAGMTAGWAYGLLEAGQDMQAIGARLQHARGVFANTGILEDCHVSQSDRDLYTKSGLGDEVGEGIDLGLQIASIHFKTPDLLDLISARLEDCGFAELGYHPPPGSMPEAYRMGLH